MQNQTSKWLTIFCLVFAGEMVFSLPFHIARFFRPTFLDVFGLSNANLGDIFAVYGTTAMLAYFPGGAIADYFSARKLMAVSLFATALGGVYMVQFPSAVGLSWLFAYWGITSILLFWAAMIKGVREWGGALAQGKAFGILDGGRGLMAAAMASIAVFILGMLLPVDVINASEQERIQALQTVIVFYIVMTTLAGIMVWLFIPDKPPAPHKEFVNPFVGIGEVIKQKVVWLQAAVVVCAYVGYKGLDNYALYAVDVLGMNELEASQFTAMAAYIRPVACVVVGLLADRFSASRTIGFGFLFLIMSYMAFVLLSPETAGTNIVYANVIISFVAVYGLRGVYFALLEETQIEARLTGTAVGIISFIGFTPDIFFGSLTGRILDGTLLNTGTGPVVYQYYFALLTAFSVVGMLAAALLANHYHAVNKTAEPV